MAAIDNTLLARWKQLLEPAIANHPAAEEPGAIDLAEHPTLLPQLVDAYTPAGITPYRVMGRASLDYGCLMVTLQMALSPARIANDYRYWVSRRIGERTRRAEHRNLYLPPGMQGRGVARALWKQALALYKTLGVIDVVWVESERVGRYANISSGLDFKDDAERQKVIAAIAAVARKLSLPFDPGDVMHPWDISALVGNTSVEEMNASGFSFDTEARFADEQAIPIGKAALLSDACPPWVGRIDLNADSVTYARLLGYVST